MYAHRIYNPAGAIYIHNKSLALRLFVDPVAESCSFKFNLYIYLDWLRWFRGTYIVWTSNSMGMAARCCIQRSGHTQLLYMCGGRANKIPRWTNKHIYVGCLELGHSTTTTKRRWSSCCLSDTPRFKGCARFRNFHISTHRSIYLFLGQNYMLSHSQLRMRLRG